MKSWKLKILFAGAILAAAVLHGDITPVVTPKAQPFPLTQVRLLDSPFRDAMLRDQKYLLSLDPDRFLCNFRVNVGLPIRPQNPTAAGIRRIASSAGRCLVIIFPRCR